MDINTEEETAAKKYVDLLLDEGARTPCDFSNETFVNQGKTLPPYFNNVLFKKGQELYLKHIYAMHVMHALGIVALYAVRSALNVATAAAGPLAGVYDLYCRQMRTNTKLHSFYYSNFETGSIDWKKIALTKSRHHQISKGSIQKGLNALTQKEMVLGQFFIVGLSLVRGEMAGMHGVTEKEWRGFHHYWRVIGYLVGIEERFNVCSISIDVTRKISELLINQVFIPAMDQKEQEFLDVAKMSCLCWAPILPDLEPKCAITHTYNLLKRNDISKIPDSTYLPMNWFYRTYYRIYAFSLLRLLQWNVYRIVRNILYKINFFLITTFPTIPKIQCKISEYIHYKYMHKSKLM